MTKDASFTLFGDLRSGNCLKVVYAADHLGLAHTVEPIDIMTGGSRTEAYLAMNPAGQVPMVRFADGRTLAQSNAIMLHLAEGSDLIPTDGFERAKMLEWMFWEQYSHEPYVAVCRFHMVYQGRAKDEREPDRVTRGEGALDLMESHLAHHEYLAGGAVSLADISLIAYTQLAGEGGFDLSTRPGIQRWIARV